MYEFILFYVVSFEDIRGQTKAYWKLILITFLFVFFSGKWSQENSELPKHAHMFSRVQKRVHNNWKWLEPGRTKIHVYFVTTHNEQGDKGVKKIFNVHCKRALG